MAKLRSLILYPIGAITVLAGLELFLNLSGVMTPSVRIDSEKGERYFPNKTCNSVFVTEGFGLAKTNSKGWFGREQVKDNDTTLSIAVVGNSFVASRQVFYRNNFISICEKHLHNTFRNNNVVMYNYGKEAMPLQELLVIEEEIENELGCDYIIVLLNELSFSNVNRLVPYYELKNENLELNVDFKRSPVFKLYDKLKWMDESSLLFLTYRVKNHIKDTPKILLDKLYFKPKERIMEETSKSEKKIINECNKMIIEKLDKNKKIVFLLDIKQDIKQEILPLIKESPIVDLNNLLTEVNKNEGIDPYYWEVSNIKGHWNNFAHKKIGEYLSNTITQLCIKK